MKPEKKPEPEKATKLQEDKFLKVLTAADVSFYKRKQEGYQERFHMIAPKEKRALDLDQHYLYVEWCSGGIGGGSCWDDGKEDVHHYSISGEPESDFDDIDTILTELCPNLSFLQYKQLMKITKRESYSQNEYYGNSTDYTYKYVLLRDLLNKLVEMGFLVG
jgi:hypothetical protein